MTYTLPGQPRRWRCQACTLEVSEDQEHLASCSGYADFPVGKDLSEERELVGFYQNVAVQQHRFNS